MEPTRAKIMASTTPVSVMSQNLKLTSSCAGWTPLPSFDWLVLKYACATVVDVFWVGASARIDTIAVSLME